MGHPAPPFVSRHQNLVDRSETEMKTSLSQVAWEVTMKSPIAQGPC